MKRNTMSYKTKQFLMFAGPAGILFLGTVMLPFIYGIYLTFTSWDGIAKEKPLVGAANYIAAFKDTAYWAALGRTAIYTVISVILVNAIAFLLAYLVTSKIKAQNFFRAAFFIPNFVAIGNAVTGDVVPSLLGTTGGALFALILASTWQYAGYLMLLYVAGFMSVPGSLKEAAEIDGATSQQAMRYVTIPMMRTTFVECIFLSITRCFVVYDVNLSLTNGEPFNSSVLAAMHVYKQAFTYKNYGVGQAEALILFVICAVIGIAQVKIGQKGEVTA